MPGFVGSTNIGPVGMTLKAWAVINGTTGAIIAGTGITLNVRTGPGVYTFNLSAGLVTNVNACAVRVWRNGTGGLSSDAWANVSSTTTIEARTFSNGAAGDVASFTIEVWAP